MDQNGQKIRFFLAAHEIIDKKEMFWIFLCYIYIYSEEKRAPVNNFYRANLCLLAFYVWLMALFVAWLLR